MTFTRAARLMLSLWLGRAGGGARGPAFARQPKARAGGGSPPWRRGAWGGPRGGVGGARPRRGAPWLPFSRHTPPTRHEIRRPHFSRLEPRAGRGPRAQADLRARARHGVPRRDRAAGGGRTRPAPPRIFLLGLPPLRRDRRARADHRSGAAPRAPGLG